MTHQKENNIGEGQDASLVVVFSPQASNNNQKKAIIQYHPGGRMRIRGEHSQTRDDPIPLQQLLSIQEKEET